MSASVKGRTERRMVKGGKAALSPSSQHAKAPRAKSLDSQTSASSSAAPREAPAPASKASATAACLRPGARRARPYPPVFVAAMILGVGLNPVNSTLISTALTPISKGIAISASEATLLVSVLYLACAIAQPTAGKLSERIGPRAVFMAGAWLVVIGGAIGGFATALPQLVVSRVLIGMGTSCGYPSAMLMVNRRARAAGLTEPSSWMLSVLAMVGLVLIAVGPPLGGVLVAAFSWRAAFLVNVPVGVLTLVLGHTALREEAAAQRAGTAAKVVPFLARARAFLTSVDAVGIALFALFVSLLLWFLLELPGVSLPCLAGAAVAFAVFVARELSVAHPFVDLRVLSRNVTLTLNFVRAMLTMLGAYVVLYALPQWLEDACGQQPQLAGMVVLPMGVVATACSLVAARKGTVRAQYVLCCAAMACAGVLLCLVRADAPVAALAASGVAGATLGLSMSVSQLVLCRQADPDTIGTASGLLRTFIYLGSIGAAAISGVLFTPQVTDAGMHAIGVVVALLGALALVLTLVDKGLREHEPA